MLETILALISLFLSLLVRAEAHEIRTAAMEGRPLTAEQVAFVARFAGLPEEEAVAVAWCESRFRPTAVGDEGRSLGLWQLWSGWFPAAGQDLEDWADPFVNAAVARYVMEYSIAHGQHPWAQWSCKP